jgi:hypothetical protein
VFDYRLGNRSELEWIIDQHQVSTDKRSGTNDTNRAGDPQYIVQLVGQVITVSMETAKLVKSLAGESLLAPFWFRPDLVSESMDVRLPSRLLFLEVYFTSTLNPSSPTR